MGYSVRSQTKTEPKGQVALRDSISQIVSHAISRAIEDGALPGGEEALSVGPSVQRPRDEINGDWASSVALKTAKVFRMPPAQIAHALLPYIAKDDRMASVEVAGPGFINMRLSNSCLQDVFRQVRAQGRQYGYCDDGQGRKVQVEFVSANPTGPMHVGHGRWAALGDAMANVLCACGWDVEREFLINDAGSQMDNFAHSVSVRYLQLCRLVQEGICADEGVELLARDAEMPEEDRKYSAELGENSYGGAYVVDIAGKIFAKHGQSWFDKPQGERDAFFKECAYSQVLEHVKEVLLRVHVSFDVWFSERRLHERDERGKCAIDDSIEILRDKGYIYEKDGATWFKSTEFCDDKDRVLVKADGSYTYFAADIAYHLDKFRRGFDRVIDLWGADHHGYISRMMSACEALGYPGVLEVVLGQLVNLLRDGKPVKLSKRAGTMVTFEELIDEVGSDATRFLMLSRSTDQQIDFDIEQARRQDSTNPVYYVQYAHARICSVLRRAAGQGAKGDSIDEIDKLCSSLIDPDVDLGVLNEDCALQLARKLSEFPEVLRDAARDLAPFRLTHYAVSLATVFHQFYTQLHVLTDDEALTKARLYALDAARLVLEESLGLLGVGAPCSM